MSTRFRTIAAVTVGLLAAIYAGTYLMSNTTRNQSDASDTRKPAVAASGPSAANLETVTFGSGCFWCTEAMFQNLRGVKSAVSGYSGGRTQNPTYEQICSGNTGHAEVVQVTFDPAVISFDDLLRVFWRTHDPTTLNRQGHDVGTQYRSAIFYHNDEQRKVAEQYKAQLDKSKAFGAPIVTEITRFEKFYPAESYHQKYFDLNPGQSYCQAVIRPKVEKFQKEFGELLETKAPKTKQNE
ncbi:MAG: peptide-methionine (S)-S-oxide reductase MsrA [Planctomycetes bacterium]|nr:peptide-methionine (S)-S-oxide reductase MsrA [Planctomycetota bacterium]